MTEILQKVPETLIGLTTISEDQFSNYIKNAQLGLFQKLGLVAPFLSPAQYFQAAQNSFTPTQI